MQSRSLIVIGAGPGGYAAALEAAARGFSVTLIERDAVGGTCLNRGCIPSKYFLVQAQASAAKPYADLLIRKDAILTTLRGRMEQAAKTAKVKIISGTARFSDPHTVEVKTADNKTEKLSADIIVLATGTQPIQPKLFPKHPAIHDSTSLLSLEKKPEHLVVVGGGYIGCELACAFHGLGSRVTLIEKEPALLAAQPEFTPAAAVLQRALQKRDITINTQTTITGVNIIDDKTLSLTSSDGKTVTADAVLLALGRKPDFDSLNIQAAGLTLENQKLNINAYGQTAVPHIYAIGDLVSPLPLAHTATREAEIAIAHVAGENPEPIDYRVIPRCIYTSPEAACVGSTSGEGENFSVDRYHFAASAKAMVEEDTEGFWAVTTDTNSGKILGALIIGPHATELIHLVVLSIKAGFTVDDVADTVFAHPTLAESFSELMKRVKRKRPGVMRP